MLSSFIVSAITGGGFWSVVAVAEKTCPLRDSQKSQEHRQQQRCKQVASALSMDRDESNPEAIKVLKAKPRVETLECTLAFRMLLCT